MTERWRELFDEARHENGQGNVSRADELVASAIEAAEAVAHDSRSYSAAQSSFALWRQYHGRYAEAEVFWQRHIDAESKHGISPRELANLVMWLADIQKQQGNFSAARRTIERAIEIYPDDCRVERSRAHGDLSEVIDKLGDAGKE